MIDRNQIYSLTIFAIGYIVIFWVFSFFQWQVYNDYQVYFFDFVNKPLIHFHKLTVAFKTIYVIFLFLIGVYLGGYSQHNDTHKVIYGLLSLVFGGLFFLGYYPAIPFYRLAVYPLIFVVFTFCFYMFVRTFSVSLKEDENILKRINTKGENLFSLAFGTNLGRLVVKNIRVGIMYIGGVGAGKTKLIESTLYQLLTKGFSAVVYEYEGDPEALNSSQGEKPLFLTKLAYQTIMENQKIDEDGMVTYTYYETTFWGRRKRTIKGKPLKFENINFTDPLRSKKVNPFNPIYHPNTISISSEANRFLKSADPDLLKGDGFWNANAFVIGESVAEILYTYYPDFCTVPHWVTLITSNTEELLELIASKEGYYNRASMLLSAYQNAGTDNKQLVSQISSAQKPLQRLYDKLFFWLFNPIKAEEEANLFINDLDNPTVLCVGNASKYQSLLSAPITSILSTIIANLDELGNNRSALIFDEFYTLNLDASQFASFMAVARKKGAVPVAGYQIKEQTEDKFGKTRADIIDKSFNNYFVFRGANRDFARNIVEDFGKRKVKKVSVNYSTGIESPTVSLDKENVINVGDILNQDTGHATGVVVDGKPKSFHVQFDLFEKNRPDDIPYQCDEDYLTHISEEVDKKIIRSLMDENMKQIKEDVEEILAPIRKELQLRKESLKQNKKQNTPGENE